jgi:hypothetical protein
MQPVHHWADDGRSGDREYVTSKCPPIDTLSLELPDMFTFITTRDQTMELHPQRLTSIRPISIGNISILSVR